MDTNDTRRSKRRTRLLGAWVPLSVVNGVREWIALHPERDFSSFVREAAREKLRRDGIQFSELAITDIPDCRGFVLAANGSTKRGKGKVRGMRQPTGK